MVSSILQFLLSGTVIVLAGASLTKFGDVISHQTRLGGLLVGSILIAGATSLPELAIDINAIRLESADLAVGDLFGSSLFNLTILAVLDLTRYSHGRMFSKASAGNALAASASIMLTAIAAVFILLGETLGDVTFLRLGPGSVAVALAYVICIRIVYFGQRESRQPSRGEGKEKPVELPVVGRLGLKGAIVGYLVAAAVILGAAPFLACAAHDLAEQTGLGGTFFGTTFVALCTSLPEVATTLSAVRLKAFDMAAGNIFGSNCFNMAILFPLDLVDAGSLLASVSRTHVYTALAAIVVTTVVILGQLYRVEKKHYFEPDAVFALVLIGAAFTGLYFVRG